jgi:hypothetical protein
MPCEFGIRRVTVLKRAVPGGRTTLTPPQRKCNERCDYAAIPTINKEESNTDSNMALCNLTLDGNGEYPLILSTEHASSHRLGTEWECIL